MEPVRKRVRADTNATSSYPVDSMPAYNPSPSINATPVYPVVSMPVYNLSPGINATPFYPAVPMPAYNMSTGINDTPFYPAVPIPAYDLWTCINALQAADDGNKLATMMLHLAETNPVIAAYVRGTYHDHVSFAQARVITFDHYSKDVWHQINTEHSSLRGSEQYEASFEVCCSIEHTIDTIVRNAGVQHASYGTKRSALETLRKIGKTICLSGGDVIPHEVQKHFQQTTAMEDAMYQILEAMSEEERANICDEHDGRSSFLDKMEELHILANSHSVFSQFSDVVNLLRGEYEDEEGEDEHEDEDGDGGSNDKEHDEKKLT